MATLRREAFDGYAKHPWLCRVHRRLSKADIIEAHSFISDHDAMDKGAFEMAVNRMWMDQPKPARWKEIMELLICANSSP